MHAWEAIQKTLDYIEDHIGEETAIETLAEIAALSPFYYQRLFSRLVKKPVREYTKLRRLARASRELADTDRRIIDVALDCGFSHHETFTRAFREAYGITPEVYRKKPVLLNQFDKPDLLLGYTLVDEGVPLISEGLVLEMNRRTLTEPITFLGVTGIIPIEGQMTAGEEPGVDMLSEVWNRFHSEKHHIPGIPGGRSVGTAYYGDAPEGHFTYFAGAEAEDSAQDDRFARWQMPARDYMVCGFEAESFEELVTVAVNKAVKYNAFWLEKRGLVMEDYSPEIYYDATSDAAYMELWMPIGEPK